MDKRMPSEAILAKKILLLRQKYKQQKKEERIFMKRNKTLVNEIQSHKETFKSLNDERLVLQKDIYNQKCNKAVSEGNNKALKNSLSSCLNHLHVFQAKVINSCIETQRERLEENNRHSSKKPAECFPQESMEQTVSEEPGRLSPASSVDEHDISNSDDGVLECKIEVLNAHEDEPVLTNHCDPSDSKQELSVLLGSFCRRDTVPIDKNTGPGFQGSKKIPLESTCEIDLEESENVLLERTGEQDYQESKNLSLEKTYRSGLQESKKVSLEITCEPEPDIVSLERTCIPDLPSENEAERICLREEPYPRFIENANEKGKFTKNFEKLSVKCVSLESLRNYEIAQSLTVFESNPEVTAKEPSTTSMLEVDLSKYYKIQQLEVSIPRLDLSAYPSLNSTIEIPKKEVSRGRKSSKNTQNEERNQRLDLSAYPSLNGTIEIPKKEVSRGKKNSKNTQNEERNQRDTTPDSASESCSSNGRALRRARNAVSYKEKTLKTKLRRS